MSSIGLPPAVGPSFRRRLADAAGALVFLLASVPLGVVYLIALPLALLPAPAPLWRLLELERSLSNRLLRARIAPPPLSAQTPLRRSQLALLGWKLPASLGGFLLCAIPVALLAALLVWSADGLGSGQSYIGPWRLGPLMGVVLLLLALPAFIVSVGVLDGTGSVLSRLARRGLGVAEGAGVPVREALAQRLGDRTLTIAYWLPERSLFVDERGHPVTLPTPASGRAWTAVEHDGNRVAAIIHDADLRARPELVEAAAAGAVLALDNERLKADLRARLEELRSSRRRIVEVGVEARRQLERDLHDGAQQHLVLLGLKLRMARKLVTTDPASAAALHDELRADLDHALRELRNLSHGIHPALLSEGGLEPAIDELARRCAVPVDLELDVRRRLPSGIETAAYFVVAESLTNVAKYAAATRAVVSVRDGDEALSVVVSDDGVGGANPEKGTGLRGLGDRVAALDGQLTIDSPPSRGTNITATFPYAVPQ